MIRIENGYISSTKGLFVHKKGTDIYFAESSALPGDTPDLFEEVREMPAPAPLPEEPVDMDFDEFARRCREIAERTGEDPNAEGKEEESL